MLDYAHFELPRGEFCVAKLKKLQFTDANRKSHGNFSIAHAITAVADVSFRDVNYAFCQIEECQISGFSQLKLFMLVKFFQANISEGFPRPVTLLTDWLKHITRYN